jgi:hypothetical protein
VGGNQAALAALTAILWTHGATAQDAAETAFIDVQLVPMDHEQVLAHQTVLVMSGGRWRTRQQLDDLLAEQKARYERVLQ